ncbi:MAG: GntR family transcriptional regulator [Terricaulis sp.]
MALDLRPGERVYQEIKQAVLSGHFAIHQRLDIDKLAAQLGVSATPVRYALAILASERLVKLNTSRMYQVAFWSERELRDLYLWRQQLTKWALESYAPAPLAASIAPERDYAGAYLAIMRHIDVSTNIEARRAARAADDRLQPALRFEKDVVQDASGELARIAVVLEKGGASLAGVLRTYFRRRVAQSAQIRSAAHASAIPDNGD